MLKRQFHSRFEYNEVAIPITDIVPRVVHLALRMHGGKLRSSCCRHMATRRRTIIRRVDGRSPELIEDITGEIPIELVFTSTDGGGVGPGDDVQTILIDILEEE